MTVSSEARTKLMWISNSDSAFKPILLHPPTVIITTDASTLGWGAVWGDREAGGPWAQHELDSHINCLEMKAVFLGLKALCKNITKQHICVQSDNTTAISYINAMGGMKSREFHALGNDIWDWCIANDIWLSASQIPGSRNIEADTESRVFKTSTEWSPVFKDIESKWGRFDMDLFASRLNYKVSSCVSWRPDPEAKFVDAFYLDWAPYLFYAFPPFSVLATCLQKISWEQATRVLIVPVWPTQPWFTVLMNLLVDKPLILPQSETLLTQPHNGDLHPLQHQLRLMACKVSGEASSREAFQTKLLPSPSAHGLLARGSNTNLILKSGSNFVLNGKAIPMILL